MVDVGIHFMAEYRQARQKFHVLVMGVALRGYAQVGGSRSVALKNR